MVGKYYTDKLIHRQYAEREGRGRVIIMTSVSFYLGNCSRALAHPHY